MKMKRVDCKNVEEPRKGCVAVDGTNTRPLHKSDEQQHMTLVTSPITSVSQVFSPKLHLVRSTAARAMLSLPSI